MDRKYYVYIVANKYNSVLYIGITGNLVRRIYEHKEKIIDGFTKKYNVNKLVYYEIFEEVAHAIKREKYIKGITRERKNKLINKFNSEWIDLYKNICS